MRLPAGRTLAGRAAALVAFARATLVAVTFLVVLAPARAFAQAPPPAVGGGVYSPYEQETIDEALKALGLKLAADPEGKTIERIDVVPLEVFEERDPLPRFLNDFHATSHESVIRREVFLRTGAPFDQVLADETIRNLRQLPQLSLVVVVATAGSRPDRVGVLVVTKDVWSLRLNWSLSANAGGLEELRLQPEERNLLGSHQDLNGNFVLEPSTLTLGLGYRIPRIATSRLVATVDADVVINRQTGLAEGSYGDVIAGQPLYSGQAEWAWDATTSWEDLIERRYVNAQPSVYVAPDCTGRPGSCPRIPFQYGARQYIAKYELRRSFGWDTKHEFTFAAGITRDVYQTNFPGADPHTVAAFRSAVVPVSDTRVGPSVQYETYARRYVRLLDFDTLALQEDYRVGHDIILRVTPSFHALGSSRDVLLLTADAQYTWALRDGLFRASFATVTDPESDRISDAAIQPTLHLVTPTVAGVGRIVFDATMLYRWRNYLNETETLGGDTRLRGFPTNFFVDWSFVSYNVEFRTRPVEVLTCQLAGVAFFDAGATFRSFDTLRPVQSAGVGIRGLFPWLDRVVFRADLGFPVERPIDPTTGAPIAPLAFVVSFGQAFDVPTVAPQPVLPTEQYEVPQSGAPP